LWRRSSVDGGPTWHPDLSLGWRFGTFGTDTAADEVCDKGGWRMDSIRAFRDLNEPVDFKYLLKYKAFWID